MGVCLETQSTATGHHQTLYSAQKLKKKKHLESQVAITIAFRSSDLTLPPLNMLPSTMRDTSSLQQCQELLTRPIPYRMFEIAGAEPLYGTTFSPSITPFRNPRLQHRPPPDLRGTPGVVLAAQTPPTAGNPST